MCTKWWCQCLPRIINTLSNVMCDVICMSSATKLRWPLGSCQSNPLIPISCWISSVMVPLSQTSVENWTGSPTDLISKGWELEIAKQFYTWVRKLRWILIANVVKPNVMWWDPRVKPMFAKDQRQCDGNVPLCTLFWIASSRYFYLKNL